MGFSLILRAFFSFPNERQFIECQFFWEFRVMVPSNGGMGGKGQKCPVCGKYTWFRGKCNSCGAKEG